MTEPTVTPFPLAGSTDWSLVDGEIRHRTGRFFQLTGCLWKHRGQVWHEPIIVQKEVGILGWLTRTVNGQTELLAQRKWEPGSGWALGPTCQATKSNAEQIHGGRAPNWHAIFDTLLIAKADSLQSEQGHWFYHKRNRNMMVGINDDPFHAPVSESHQWLSTRSIGTKLLESHTVNTDARSALVCSPWKDLIHDPENELQQALRESLEATESTDAVRAAVTAERAKWVEPALVPLNLCSDESLTRIKHVKVAGAPCEVAEWDQPLLNLPASETTLHMERPDQIRFCFAARHEPGLLNRVELDCRFPDWIFNTANDLAAIAQSDEGNRFDHTDNGYAVNGTLGSLMLPRGPQEHWLTLGQIQELLLEGGWFTNETRSALSLVLGLMMK